MVKAAVCREFGKPLSIEDIKLRTPADGEVLIDVRACAICHSDISYAHGEWGGQLPAVYGHEAAGIVRQTGPDVMGLNTGDRVIATLIRHCGECHYCGSGCHILCEGDFGEDSAITAVDGSPLNQGLRTGAFARQILVHHSQVETIPPDLPFDQASLIACAVLTGFGAVFNTARISPSSSAVVIGCGGVGLNAVQAARLAGADPVIALDTSPLKREAARRFGATHDVDPATAAGTIRSLTDGRGADHVIVTVGAKSAIEGAHDYLAANGSVVVVGMPASGVLTSFDPSCLAGCNQRILGSKMGEARLKPDVPLILEAWRAGRFQLEALISGRYPLDRINEAIDAVVNGDALRNVIVFDE